MTNSKQGRQPSDTGKKDNERQGAGRQGQGQDRQRTAQKAFKKEDLPDPDKDPVTEDEDPGFGQDPEKRIQIDDNPEETKRKIPH